MTPAERTRLWREQNKGKARVVVQRRPAADRFWAKVAKTEGCWEWIGCRKVDGYGEFGERPGRGVRSHRFSWELHHGPIPDGLCVLHRCDNPPCVRPDHLFLGTNADNVADRSAKGRSGAPAGERHPSAKLTPDKVRQIRDAGGSARAVGERFGVSGSTVQHVRDGRNWCHVR